MSGYQEGFKFYVNTSDNALIGIETVLGNWLDSGEMFEVLGLYICILYLLKVK